MSRKSVGNAGEDDAAQFLEARGYRIAARNVRPLPGMARGEIDIIAWDVGVLCFVEVKTRINLKQGQPFEAINPWKIRKLSQMALSYLKYKFHSIEILSRFDVISIIQEKNEEPKIKHIKNAFDSVY